MTKSEWDNSRLPQVRIVPHIRVKHTHKEQVEEADLAQSSFACTNTPGLDQALSLLIPEQLNQAVPLLYVLLQTLF